MIKRTKKSRLHDPLPALSFPPLPRELLSPKVIFRVATSKKFYICYKRLNGYEHDIDWVKITMATRWESRGSEAFYGNYQYGANSEGIRHTIQNRWIHNLIGSPHFKVLNNNRQSYFRIGTSNPYTLW
jgi:hypothetical protein